MRRSPPSHGALYAEEVADMQLREIASLLGGEVSSGDQVLAPGPGHSQEDRSLSVKLDKDAPDGFVVHSFAGDDSIRCRDHVRERLGLAPFKPNGNGRQRIVETYPYEDEGGELLFEVVRFEPKRFAQRRPDGNGGWVWKLGKARRVPYRLPELLEAVANDQMVFVAEGEKDVEAAWQLGVAATCNPGGAGKWRDEYAQHLKDTNVVILPDNDQPGRDHAQKVARSLHGVAASVKVLDLPDLPEHGDVSDWIEAGGTAEQLERLADEAEAWAPKARKRKKDDLGDIPEANAEPVVTAEDIARWEASARHIIECDDVLDLFARELQKLIAGEESNAKVLYLVGTSRLLDKPMHAALKGTSASGKSELRRRVLAFFPVEDVVSFTTLSERALLYFPGDFAHCILSMGEAAGVEEATLQDYLLRELISEGRLRYPVVQRVEAVGLVTTIIEKNGPVSFLVTTTKGQLHPENETRLLSLEIDDSEQQTKRVLRKVAEVEGLDHGEDAIDYAPWHDFQRWLKAVGGHAVVVPFAEALALAIPPASVRLRRDFGQILRAIKVHALLHRRHRLIDDCGRIIADIEYDYATVRDLMNALIAESAGVAVRPGLQETIEAVALETAGLAKDEGASALAVAKRLKLDKSAAWRRLKAAMSEGFLLNLETRRGQPGRYRCTGQKIEPVEILPPPEAIAEALEEVMQPVQPRNRTDNRQVFEELSDCASGCTVAPVASHTDAAAAHMSFEERAAIFEYDAGLDRAEAEQAAAEELWPDVDEATRALYESLGDIPDGCDRRV